MLPKGFAQLVLAIQERLIWEATYRVEGYDPADYDEIQDIVGLGLGGLTDSMPITDLLAALQSVEDAIYLTACCDALTGDSLEIQKNTDPVTEGVGDVPANVVASGYAADPTDWAGFRDYKCDAAHVLVDSAIVISNQLAQALDLIDLPLGAIGAIAAIAGIVGAIYATGGLALVFGITGAAGAAATLWSFFAEVGDEAFLETSATEFETYRNDIVCAIMNADGHTAAAAAVRAVIDASFTFPTIPKLYFWDSYLAALYDGRWGDTDFAQSVKDSDRFGSSCPCVGPQSEMTWLFNSDTEGWELLAGGGTNHVATGGCTLDPEGTGYLQVTPGSGQSVRSPSFVVVECNRASVNLCVRSRFTDPGQTTFAQLRRASDDSILDTTPTQSIQTGWHTFVNVLNFVTIPEGTEVYLVVRSYAFDLDKVELALQKI